MGEPWAAMAASLWYVSAKECLFISCHSEPCGAWCRSASSSWRWLEKLELVLVNAGETPSCGHLKSALSWLTQGNASSSSWPRLLFGALAHHSVAWRTAAHVCTPACAVQRPGPRLPNTHSSPILTSVKTYSSCKIHSLGDCSHQPPNHLGQGIHQSLFLKKHFWNPYHIPDSVLGPKGKKMHWCRLQMLTGQ